jgi:hypothetical protein
MNFIEKRKLKRFSLELRTLILAEDEDPKEKIMDGITSNVCSGGAFLKVTSPIPVGTIVYIKLFLSFKDLNKFGSKGSYFHALGHVIRTEDNGMAVIFDKLFNIKLLTPK